MTGKPRQEQINVTTVQKTDRVTRHLKIPYIGQTGRIKSSPDSNPFRWTSERMWEERNTVMPFLFLSFNISKNSLCIRGSNPPVGSSRMQSNGSCCRAQTTASFFRFPNESSLIRREGSSCNRSHRSADAFRQSFRRRSAESRIRSRPRISG